MRILFRIYLQFSFPHDKFIHDSSTGFDKDNDNFLVRKCFCVFKFLSIHMFAKKTKSIEKVKFHVLSSFNESDQ